MEFINYLSFIQVSIAFNFASAFWKKEGKDDVIEEMFGQLYDEGQLEDNLNHNQMLMSEIEQYRPVQTSYEEDVIGISMKRYHNLKIQWESITQKIIDIYRQVLSRDRSTFFNDVCIVLGLYGLLQLFILPDISKPDFIVWRNAYIYCSEILLGILSFLLVGELGLRFGNIRFGSKISRLFSIFIFCVIVLFSCFLSSAYYNGYYSPFSLWISEDQFIYYTIYITYISYIVYFVVVFLSYLKDKWMLRIKLPKLMKERKKMQDEYVKNLNKRES